MAKTDAPQLGDRVKDVVTGFIGIVQGEYKYLTGCTQYGVSPEKLDKEGNPGAWATFDEARLVVVKRGACKLAPAQADGGPSPFNGAGPRVR